MPGSHGTFSSLGSFTFSRVNSELWVASLFARILRTLFSLHAFLDVGAQGLFRGVSGSFILFTIENCLPICDINGSVILAKHLTFSPVILFSGSWFRTGLLSISMYAVLATAPLTWSLLQNRQGVCPVVQSRLYESHLDCSVRPIDVWVV